LLKESKKENDLVFMEYDDEGGDAVILSVLKLPGFAKPIC
jgi:hypothetical protein